MCEIDPIINNAKVTLSSDFLKIESVKPAYNILHINVKLMGKCLNSQEYSFK